MATEARWAMLPDINYRRLAIVLTITLSFFLFGAIAVRAALLLLPRTIPFIARFVETYAGLSLFLQRFIPGVILGALGFEIARRYNWTPSQSSELATSPRAETLDDPSEPLSLKT